MSKLILDLCGGTGAWSLPYKEAGYEVIVVDTLYGTEYDVRIFEWQYLGKPIHGVLAAPPCTHFSASGARWWKEKGEEVLLDHLAIVDACIRIATMSKPRWWCLENPVGRLSHYLGRPKMTFNPFEYGDPYTKRTCLWGNFSTPERNLVENTEGSKTVYYPPGPDRWQQRSITPAGFAQAFFEANP